MEFVKKKKLRSFAHLADLTPTLTLQGIVEQSESSYIGVRRAHC
jgi:hypothetical protein